MAKKSVGKREINKMVKRDKELIEAKRVIKSDPSWKPIERAGFVPESFIRKLQEDEEWDEANTPIKTKDNG